MEVDDGVLKVKHGVEELQHEEETDYLEEELSKFLGKIVRESPLKLVDLVIIYVFRWWEKESP